MKVSRIRVGFQVVLHLVLIGHVLAYYLLDWKSVGALDFQAFFHHLLGEGLLTAGALLTLAMFAVALVFGRLFCSWGCHFAATQDLAAWILRRLGWRPPLVRTRFLHLAPYALLFAVFLVPIWSRWLRRGWGPLRVDFSALGPWDTLPGWFLSIVTFAVCGAGILLFLGTRGFCRFVCPYGAVFRITDRFAALRVRRVSSCGTDCTPASVPPCTGACPTAIDVHEETSRFSRVVSSDCVRCHLCIEACPSAALANARASREIAPSGPAPAVSPPPAPERYSLPLWGEILVVVVATCTFVAADLVYGGHFLAATLALAEGFLAYAAVGVLSRRLGGWRTSTPVEQTGARRTFVDVTVVGVFLLSLVPLFEAGAFKLLRARALRLDPAVANAGTGAHDRVADTVSPARDPHERRDLARAAEYYLRALAYVPRSLETRRLLVSAYARLGDYRHALAHAEILVRHAPPGDRLAAQTVDWLRARRDASERLSPAPP